MTNTPDTELTVTVENPHPEPEEEKAVEETTDDAKPEETVFEDSRLAESVLDGARPIIPAPANLAPTPPAHDEAETARLPQPQTGSLDLTEPILDILTNPAV